MIQDRKTETLSHVNNYPNSLCVAVEKICTARTYLYLLICYGLWRRGNLSTKADKQRGLGISNTPVCAQSRVASLETIKLRVRQNRTNVACPTPKAMVL